MTKAIAFLDPEGVARTPSILCAESAEEAQAKKLPLFTTVFAQLTAGMELHPDGDGYRLFEKGKPVGILEIFAPHLPAK